MGTLVEHQHPICHLDHRQSHPHVMMTYLELAETDKLVSYPFL